MFDIKSAIRGIKAMTKDHEKVNIKLTFIKPKKPHFDLWTPVWHNGRGPYITISFFIIAFYRGY